MARIVVKRPRLLLVLLFLLLLQGVLYLVLAFQFGRALVYLQDTAQGWNEHGFTNPESTVRLALFLGTWGALGGASIVMTLGMQSGRAWGWTGSLVIEGASLILMLQSYFTKQASDLHYLALALAVGITFLLNQRDVRIFFHTHRQEMLEPQPIEPLPDSLEH